MVTPDYAYQLLDSKLKKNQEITKEELMELVDSISVGSEGSITLTYSGPMGYRDAYGQNVSAKDEVERISRNHSETRTVDHTPAAKLLNDEVFKKAVASAFNVSPSEVERRGTEANQFLHDPVEGAWAKVSKRFVTDSNTKGNIRVVAPGANPNRVLAKSELSAVLDNKSITHVEGVSAEVLRNMPLSKAFEVISEQSQENLRDVDKAQAIYENVAFSQNFSVREQVLAYDNYRNALCQLVDQKVDLFNQQIKHVNGQHLTNDKQEQKQKENQEPEQDIQKLDGQSNNEIISDFKSNLDSSPDVKSGSHSQLEQLIEKNIESLTQEPEQNQEKKQKPEQGQVKGQEQAQEQEQEQVQEQEQKENQGQKQDVQQMDKQDSDQKQEQDQNQEQAQSVQQLTR